MADVDPTTTPNPGDEALVLYPDDVHPYSWGPVLHAPWPVPGPVVLDDETESS